MKKSFKATLLGLALLATVSNSQSLVAADTPPKPGGVQILSADTPPKPGG